MEEILKIYLVECPIENLNPLISLSLCQVNIFLDKKINANQPDLLPTQHKSKRSWGP